MAKAFEKDEMMLKELESASDTVIKKYFLQYQNNFIRFICKMYKVEEEKAKSIYPEAFSKFYFNIKQRKLTSPLRSTLQTYLFSIGKHVFHNTYFNKYQRSTDFPEEMPENSNHAEELDYFEYDDQKKLVKRLLAQINEKCRVLLEMTYIKNYEPEAIVERLNIPSNGAYRKRKFDCLKKLRKLYQS